MTIPQPAPKPAPEQEKPFRSLAEMSAREWRHWIHEANRLYPRVNRRYS